MLKDSAAGPTDDVVRAHDSHQEVSMRRTCARVLAVVAFAGLLSSAGITAALSAAHGVLPLHAKYKGLAYGEWLALSWQAAFAIPVEGGGHPLITGGAFGGDNRMTSLWAPVVPAGSPGATIPVTIPPGQHLSVGTISVECSVAEAPPAASGQRPQRPGPPPRCRRRTHASGRLRGRRIDFLRGIQT
jgi:hypothetical protein